MDLNWVTNPLTIYGTVAAMGFASLHLAIAGKLEVRREQQRRERETGELRSRVESLEVLVETLQTEARDAALPMPYPPPSGLNRQKRSDALRMYRRGSERVEVAGALGMPEAQLALLEKVRHILDSAPRPAA